MHRLFERANGLTERVIGAAIEVHRELGPGLLESIYERCLVHELGLRGIRCESQRSVTIRYKELTFAETLRCDLLADACLLVELKCVEQILPIHKAQLLSYMKLMDIPVGLVLNFKQERLTKDLSRLILPGANRQASRE